MRNRFIGYLAMALAVLAPGISHAAGGDVYINQRILDNTATTNRTLPKPSANAVMGYDINTNLPVFFSLGSNITLSGGVLNVPVTAGATGATGPAGPAGAASTVPGPTGPTGPASTVPGPVGASGSNGADGISPVLSIGTVSSGSSPSATITGTTAAPKLNLMLQKGDTGATGQVGAQGAAGVAGATGATGPAGAVGPAGADAVLPARYYKKLNTDATGALTVTFPAGRFSVAPEISAQVISSDQGYIYTAQVLSVSATSATVQVSRVTMSTFTLLGLTTITVASKPTTAQVVSIRADLASD